MTSPLSHITTKVQEYVLQLFNQQKSSQLLFHDFRRATEIGQLIQDIGNYSGFSEFSSEVEVARLASWFFAGGKLMNYTSPLEAARNISQEFFRRHEYPEASKVAVSTTLEKIVTQQAPQTASEQLLHDANLAYWNTSNFVRLSPLMRLEEELITSSSFSKEEWEQRQLERLLEGKFYTPYGQMVFQPILAQNIAEQKTKTENLILKSKNKKKNGDGLLRIYQGLEPKMPVRGGQTFFRVVFQNHIQLSAIADNKANIMTGINTILVSVIVSVISYSSINFKEVRLFMPIALLLLTALVSLTFSILAASPRVTKRNKKVTNNIEARKNVAFFGNFSQMKLEDFEEAIDAMLRSDELVYGNMTRDLFFLGKTLDTKYKLLRVSYHVFLVGFLLSALLSLFFIVKAGGI